MPKGIFRTAADAAAKVTLADFSYYPNDSLAQLIVDAWVDPEFEKLVLNPASIKALLADRGVYLKKPVVITEAEYNNGYTMKSPDELVFVLPDKTRAGAVPAGKGGSLLETARLLMACTPHGI